MEDVRNEWQAKLESAIVGALKTQTGGKSEVARRPKRNGSSSITRLVEPMGVATVSLASIPQALRYPGDFIRILLKTMRQAFWGPFPFFAVVSVLLGFTILFVLTHVVPEGIAPATLVKQIGGSYVTALAPAISAFLFVAASGNSINAWLGSMGLTRQVAALEALGIQRTRYLWAPAWLGLGLSYLCIVTLFAAGLLAGGLALCAVESIPDAWAFLAGDLMSPKPEREQFRSRAVWLSLLYAGGIAADVIAKGGREKPSAESVTEGMTRSVVACTLWVVALELISALWLFSSRRG